MPLIKVFTEYLNFHNAKSVNFTVLQCKYCVKLLQVNARYIYVSNCRATIEKLSSAFTNFESYYMDLYTGANNVNLMILLCQKINNKNVTPGNYNFIKQILTLNLSIALFVANIAV